MQYEEGFDHWDHAVKLKEKYDDLLQSAREKLNYSFQTYVPELNLMLTEIQVHQKFAELNIQASAAMSADVMPLLTVMQIPMWWEYGPGVVDTDEGQVLADHVVDGEAMGRRQRVIIQRVLDVLGIVPPDGGQHEHHDHGQDGGHHGQA